MKQKKQFRKGIIVILVLMILGTMSAFAAVDSFTIGGETVSGDHINQGDIFIYKLTVKNTSAKEILAVEAKISGDFMTVDGSEVDFDNLLANESKTFDVPMEYIGSSDQMNIYVHGADGNASVRNITISKAVTTRDQTPSTPVDKDKYYSDFNLISPKTPVFFAGQKGAFSFELENITTYHAKEVQVQIINDSDDFPFDDMTNALITSKESFKSKEKKGLSISIETKESAYSGFYTLPVKITYKNVYGLSSEITKNIQMEIVNRNILPTLVIDELQMKTEKLVPGESNFILLNIRNLGSIDVKNVNAVLKGIDVNGVTLSADSAKKSIARIDAGERSFITYKVSVSEELDTNRYEMSLEVTYFDEYGKTYSETLPVYIPVNSSSSNIYDVDVDVTSVPSKVVAGSEFTVSFDVKNTGLSSHKKLKLGIKSDGNFIFKSQPIIILEELKAGEKKSFEFIMISDQNMTTNNYPTYISVEKTDGSLADSVIEYLGIFVDGEAGAMSKPKIIIDSYDIGGSFVLAGQEFDMDITFFNTSNTMGIQNAKVSLVVDEGAFVPVNSASSFYIDKIGTKEKITQTIRMKAKADLAVKTYNVTTEIEYEDSNGNSYDVNKNPYAASESMAIPVMQELRLEVDDITIPEMAFTYQAFELYVEFFNMGKSTLSNMLVSTEGDFEIQDGKFFVGNFAPGSNEYYSCNIIPLTPGPNSGTVIFEFEDAIGDKHTVEKEISFEVIETQNNFEEGEGTPPVEFGGGDMGGDFKDFENEKSSPLKFVIMALAFVILVVIVVVVIKRKKRKQKEMELDE